MKKTAITFLLILSAFFTVYSQNTGVIRDLRGEVTLKPEGASSFTYANIGSEVTPGTIISTGFRSSAVIAVGNSLITVRALTRMSFAEIRTSTPQENSSLNLQTGRIKIEVKPPAGARVSSTVTTPSSVASVRGTVFEIDARDISVLEGLVVFESKNGLKFAVSKGKSTGVTENGHVLDPEIVSAESLLPSVPEGSGEACETIGPVMPGAREFDITLDW